MNARAKINAVRTLLALKQEARNAQAGADLQLQKVIRLLALGETVEVDEVTYELKDNFANGNTAFRPAAFHRFDIVEVK